MEPGKKIAFAFNKPNRKPILIKSKPVEEKELIDCLEGQSIKVKNAHVIVKQPLIIPIKDNKRNLLDRVRESRAIADKKKENGDTRPDSELTIDELAARELLNDAKKRLAEKESSTTKVHVLPFNEENVSLDGEKEATLEDYENVPISDYGLAMLRGMGWKEGTGIGKTAAKIMPVVAPDLRPKGLGLGASKLVKSETPSQPVCDSDGQALTLKKGSFAKIIAGSHKGNYCEVQGLDDESGRIIVRTSLKGEILALNEFLVVLVTKDEYSRGSKILNNVKYEEFKEKEKNMVKEENDEEISSRHESSRSKSKEKRTGKSRNEKNHKSRYKDVSRSEERRSKGKYKDESSSSSDSEMERARKQHKRKDKRRHRDKSRSPRREKAGNYKKTTKTSHRDVSSTKSDKYSRSRDRKSSSSSDSSKDFRKNKR